MNISSTDTEVTNMPSALSSSRGERIAHYISDIFNPLFVAAPTFLVAALMSAPDLLHAFLWWGIVIVGVSILPYLFIARGVRQGKYTDKHVSRREQRLVPVLFALVCMTVSFFILVLLQASRPLLGTTVAMLISLILALVITSVAKWKISLHMIGISGACTMLVVFFGPLFLLLTPLAPLIGWARWKVGAHNVLQACAGTLLAVMVTLVTFWGFGLL
ncbi:hypothetical protein [Ktedonospora formicarum]|uniref:PAP2 superfamily protein n=1 Tax=Ktedonospora formicarum TaxID=2778364 RepID=A0A8J3IE09_9CHLR|nr:hypothetical protein [Ktedonospora formicarum]GHO51037.1 hypothetical protein KSX_92000 [Ktedonospora formicarum]